MTAIVSEVLQAAASDVSKSGSEDALRTVNRRDVFEPLARGIKHCCSHSRVLQMGKLVQHLASGALQSSSGAEMQGEILHNLHDAQAGEQIEPASG